MPTEDETNETRENMVTVIAAAMYYATMIERTRINKRKFPTWTDADDFIKGVWVVVARDWMEALGV